MGVPCVCASYASSQGVSSFYQTFHTVCPDIARCEFGADLFWNVPFCAVIFAQ